MIYILVLYILFKINAPTWAMFLGGFCVGMWLIIVIIELSNKILI